MCLWTQALALRGLLLDAEEERLATHITRQQRLLDGRGVAVAVPAPLLLLRHHPLFVDCSHHVFEQFIMPVRGGTN